MLTPTFPAYVKEKWNSSDFTISLVISLFALSAIIARIFAGEALKRGSRNLILYAGLCIVALSTAGYYGSGTIAALLLMRMIFGIGFGMTSTAFPTMVSDVIPLKRMGEGMGYYGLSTSLSMSIAPVIGLWLLNDYGFGALVIASASLIILIFPLSYLIRSAKSPAQLDQKKIPSKASTKIQIIDKKIFLPCCLNLLLSITYGGLISFLALFGKETHIANVGWFFLCNAIAIVLVRPISGKIFDKKGHIAILPLGAVLVIVGLVILSYTQSMNLLILSSVFYGLGYGMIQPSIQAWTIKLVSPEQRGMANAAFLNSIDLGVAIGSMFLGMIATAANYAVMYRLSAICMVLFLFIYMFTFLRNAKHQKSHSHDQKLSA
ncbi:MFS transporter [Thermoflavimicrobium daqui]|uniref:MFS transporter n=2 Tax=Thermoflavimicrobium daqui TaxID=2137476 RepID=A0A364K134_9BACL|nr:MFS transporter [Thermoflavimicrobium daqui]